MFFELSRGPPPRAIKKMKDTEYIPARKSQLKFYKEIELFNKVEEGGFVLYKKSGLTLGDMRLDEGIHPENLYIKQSDKLAGLQEAQKGFNSQLKDDVRSGNPDKVKETLVTVVDETLMHPRSGSLEGFSDTMDVLVSDYSEESSVVSSILNMSTTDYSTVLHSINVMAFALGFASHMGYSQAKAKNLGLSALLHDVGKTKINQEILTAPRKLTDEEFAEMKSHTTKGYNILQGCNFASPDIALGAFEHHEKLDGSGYPNGKTKISMTSQIIGIIDCYEALTNDDRPYRSAMGVFDPLKEIIGKDVEAGKFNKDIYSEFVISLAGRSGQQPRVIPSAA